MRTFGAQRAARRWAAGILLAATLLAGAGPAAAADQADTPAAATARSWVVIVDPSNPLRTTTLPELERMFRRRTRFWTDGRPILAVNLPADAPLRRAFDVDVLRATGDELAMWWNREYFQGVTPPTVMQSSAAVRALVAVSPTAIGYVDAATVDASVAVVEVSPAR